MDIISEEINWWVAVTNENKEILGKWRGCVLEKGKLVGIVRDNYDGSFRKGHNPINSTRDTDRNGFDFGNEITFAQFCQFILKEEIIHSIWI